MTFMIIGSYSLSNSMFDVGTLILFGVLGYAFRKADFPLAPAAMTLILGPLIEKKLRLALELSAGDFSVFVTSPVSAILLALTAIIILRPMIRILIAKIRGSTVSGGVGGIETYEPSENETAYNVKVQLLVHDFMGLII